MRELRFPLRKVVAASLVALTLGACASVETRRRPEPALSPQAGVSFALYADDDARAAGITGPAGVVAVLERKEKEGYRPIFRGIRPDWAVTGLEPGHYRIVVASSLDPSGLEVPLPRTATQRFRAREGELTEIAATMSHVSKGWIAAGIVAGVVAAVLLDEWLSDKGLPTPPLPPLPPIWVADLALSVVLDLSSTEPGPDLDSNQAAPFALAGLFPPPGATVPPGRVRVVVAFATDPGSVILAPEEVRVTVDENYQLPGTLSWDRTTWRLVWESDEDVDDGSEVRVEIGTGALRGRGERELPAVLSTQFRIGG